MLWVVAAGQAESERDEGADLETLPLEGPMNLGDFRNVIVVTAVDRLMKPRKLYFANYSSALRVHIAAPGLDIPSTVRDGKYFASSGTSPATAFVAGTASAMIGSSSYYKNRAERVKTRLQVTARPVLNDEDSGRIASGVLDYEAALLDPTVTWAKFVGTDKYEQIKVGAWCGSEIHLMDPRDATKPLHNETIQTGSIRTEDLYRLYRDLSSNNWMIYKRTDTLGEVLRLGPAAIEDADLFGITEVNDHCPNNICKLSTLQDLIVEADRVRKAGCHQ